MQLSVLTVGLAGLFSQPSTPPGGSDSTRWIHEPGLGPRAARVPRVPFRLNRGLDIVVSKITVVPGGSSELALHPGGAIVVVQQGRITICASAGIGDGRHCVSTTYRAGQSFVELPGAVVQAVNTGSIDFILFVTFPGVPLGGASRIDQPQPAGCTV